MPEETVRELANYRIHRVLAEAWGHSALRDTLDVVAEGVTDVAGFGVACLSVLHDSGELEVVAVSGNEDARQALLGTFSPVSQMLEEIEHADEWGSLRFVPHSRVGDFVRTGWVPDIEPVEDDPLAWHPLDLLAAPLLDESGELRGFLTVDLPEDGRRPGPERRRQLQMYADQAGRAIISAMERERQAEELRLADTARKIVRNASAQLNLDRILEECQKAIVDGFRIQGLWIQLYDVDGRGLEHGAVSSADGLGVELPDDLRREAVAAATVCWREQRVGIVSQRRPAGWLFDERQNARISGFLSTIDITSMMFVPLGAGPECLGHLVLTRDDGDPEWSDVEAAVALDMGHDLGRAVLNARLFEREHRLVAELQRLDAYKGQLIATVSHELKNPLSSIIGHLEILESVAGLGPSTRTSLAAIERGATRLNKLVEDLLLLSQVTDPDKPLVAHPVDLRRHVIDAVELVEVAAQRKELTVTLALPDEPILALGDAEELDRVCANLVSNAVKYTPATGTVRLSLTREGDEIVLTCADDGIGIGVEDQKRLFSEFFRSTNPEAIQQPGTGLGLAIVRRIVERHRGRIDVTSTLGQGSTFVVRLPAS